MRSVVLRLKKNQHALLGALAMGATGIIAGLIQADPRVMGFGIGIVLVAVSVLVLVRSTQAPLEGDILVRQQPQLTDVRAHATHMQAISQAP